MSESMELLGNDTINYRNVITYFGVRNEMGYHLDDIFLHALNTKYSNILPSGILNTYEKSTAFRLLFYDEVKRLNQNRYIQERPNYLQLSEDEKQRGRVAFRNPATKSWPYYGFRLNIQIPTIDEMEEKLPAKEAYIGSESQYPVGFLNSNKYVMVGYHYFDSSERDQQKIRNHINEQEALQNPVTRLSSRGYKHLKGSKCGFWERQTRSNGKYVNSGNEAYELINNTYLQNKPITELYLSTHGTVYAIDFNNSGNNIYIQDTILIPLVYPNRNSFPHGTLSKSIRMFRDLVYTRRLASDVTITLAGCFCGAQLGNMESVRDDTGNNFRDDEKEIARRFIDMNRNRNDYEIQNLAFLLSQTIPAATIVAARSKNNASNGIQTPVVYQNGLRWNFPLNIILPEDITTLYPFIL